MLRRGVCWALDWYWYASDALFVCCSVEAQGCSTASQIRGLQSLAPSGPLRWVPIRLNPWPVSKVARYRHSIPSLRLARGPDVAMRRRWEGRAHDRHARNAALVGPRVQTHGIFTTTASVKRLVTVGACDNDSISRTRFACGPHLSVFRRLIGLAKDRRALLPLLEFSILKTVGIAIGVFAAI